MSAGSAASVPHIDIEPFRTGSEHDKRRVAREVGRACEEIGFLTIVKKAMGRSTPVRAEGA
jgi:isopenicillin N synthase-like dioxygenase